MIMNYVLLDWFTYIIFIFSTTIVYFGLRGVLNEIRESNND